MRGTQQTDKKETPLARHSRKRGDGSYCFIYCLESLAGIISGVVAFDHLMG